MRTLRSNSRREKLQVEDIKREHINKIAKVLRENVNSVTRINRLEQHEFLSLFDLIPLEYRNGIKGQVDVRASKVIKKVEITKKVENIAKNVITRDARKTIQTEDIKKPLKSIKQPASRRRTLEQTNNQYRPKAASKIEPLEHRTKFDRSAKLGKSARNCFLIGIACMSHPTVSVYSIYKIGLHTIW